MSTDSSPPGSSPTVTPARGRLTPMVPRDPAEPGRTASTLELFFDLVFVVAVSTAAVQLHHALSEAHVLAASPRTRWSSSPSGGPG